jgi:outer membrane protein OmpA-like peptidoglycan-associated protein
MQNQTLATRITLAMKYNLLLRRIFTAIQTVCILVCLSAGAFAQQADNPVTVKIENEKAVNGKGLEFSPTFYEDGIVFISTNPAGLKKETDASLKLPAMSILRSRRDSEGQLGKPEPFAKEISSNYHEGPVCFDRTAETVFFSTNVVIGGKEKLDKKGTQRMRLYCSKKAGEVWGEPMPLPFNTNEFDDCHPAISIDGDKLYFASNRPGGNGGMDLYVAYKVGESWSEPVNLGPTVNTKGNEVFPFVHADGTLYFASSGLTNGKGGLDLYAAKTKEDAWETPVNLGQQFNTGGDDFGLIVDLDKINGYYSSNGKGGAGGDEIFSFHTENGNLDDLLNPDAGRKMMLNIVVKDAKSSRPIEGAMVSILNGSIGNPIGRDSAGNLIVVQSENGKDVIRSISTVGQTLDGKTDREGKFAAELRGGTYILSASKTGYKMQQLRMVLSKDGQEAVISMYPDGDYAGKLRWNAALVNYATNSPMAGATVVLTNRATGKQDTVYADANGVVDHYLDPNAKYRVDMYQGNRPVGNADINTAGWSPNKVNNQNFAVAPMMPGSVIDLPNIYYNFNDATLRPDARKDLDLVISLLQQQPGISIELASHTDARGNSYYNEELSQRRANGVVEYLVTRGIERSRLKPTGYGESELRNRCTDGVSCTEQEHARNRRTELRIIAGMKPGSFTYVDGGTPEPQNTYETPPNIPPTSVDKTPASSGARPSNYTNNGGVNPGNLNGTFYVVAGSFQLEANAIERMKSLREAGYSEAEIVRFPRSNFHSVCAGRYGSRDEAMATEKALEATGIDAFVRASNLR